MKKIDPLQIVSILANVGVIAGIVFLGIELRQNNRLLDVEVRANYTGRASSVLELVIQQPDLVMLMEKEPESLTETERNRLRLLGIRLLLTTEQNYKDVIAGFQDEAEVRRFTKSIYDRPVLNYGVPLAWETYKLRASPEFVEWMEANVIAPGPPQ